MHNDGDEVFLTSQSCLYRTHIYGTESFGPEYHSYLVTELGQNPSL